MATAVILKGGYQDMNQNNASASEVAEKETTLSDMETIFDHNPTDEELKRFGGREAIEKCSKYGLDFNGDIDTNYYRLGLLFAMRNNKTKANEYWSKMRDKLLLSTLIQDCP